MSLLKIKRFTFVFTISLLNSLNLSTLAEGESPSEPFKLGVEQKNFFDAPETSYPAYPAYPTIQYQKPQMVPSQPKMAKPIPTPKPKAIKGNIQQVQTPPIQAKVQQQPMKAQVPVVGVLPGEFLGRWQVLGSRSQAEAQPQYQGAIDGIFSGTTANTWTIQGNPQQGYVLNTDSGVSTPLMVQSQGNTAILRYQHPIKNTMAQEAIVMQLGPGGAQFDGLERITIVKQGEPQPRCKVTYKLVGRRQ